jgi:predicted dienelactone hydrolase
MKWPMNWSMKRPMNVRHVLTCSVLLLASAASHAAPPLADVSAPELARPGTAAAGVKELRIVQREQMDVAQSLAQQRVVTTDRSLRLLVWYPAKPGGKPVPYRATLTAQPPLPPKSFSMPATAVPNATSVGTSHPVLIISHGSGNDPAMQSWIAENLATKGYVVVGIGHDDPPYGDRRRLLEALTRRPLDIAFVESRVREGLLGDLADPQRIALLGYSLGGFGVLTAAGAALDLGAPSFQALPAPLRERYAADLRASGIDGKGIRAVVAIAPGGRTPFPAWGESGLSGIRAPLLTIAGDADRTVGFENGPARIFADAVNSDRTMLVFKRGGHSIGADPVPPEMRDSVWNEDWFEDPVWRKERIVSISLHFITAFLDLHLKGDATRAEYLQVANEDSDQSPWTGPDGPYDAISAGAPNTAWKGFVRNHQVGLVLRRLPAKQ